MSNFRRSLMGGVSRYQRLEYIRSTGTQYILFPDITAPTTYVAFVLQVKSNIKDGTQIICANSSQGSGGSWGGNADGKWSCGPSKGGNSLIRTNDVTFYFYADKTQLFLNDSYIGESGRSSSADNPPRYSLFAAYDGAFPFSGDLYEVSIYKDYSIIMTLYPYRNPNGEIGLYDEEHDVFYPNSGAGEFVAGPDVN